MPFSFHVALMLAARFATMIECTSVHSHDRRSHANGISLIQLSGAQVANNQIDGSDWPLPSLKGVAQSFFSTDASKSAAFLMRYFANTRLLHENSRGSDGQKISVVEYCASLNRSCQLMKFVEAAAAPDGAVPVKEFVTSAGTAWSRVGANAIAQPHVSDYSPWIDFHIGMSGEDFKTELAIQDRIMVQKYDSGNVLRVPLLSTTYTLELMVFDLTLQKKLLDFAGVPGPDLCRHEKDPDYGTRAKSIIWWKSTWAAPEPNAAAEFVVHALGARRVTTPFQKCPTPPCTGTPTAEWNQCPTVDWVVLPANPLKITEEQALEVVSDYPDGLMLHFVKNRGWPDSDKSIKSIDEFAEHQEKLRNLNADVFDQYMINHVELKTNSLDPFVARFKRLGIPYISRKDPESFSVYIDVPKNGIVLKISSSTAPTVVGDRFDETWPVD